MTPVPLHISVREDAREDISSIELAAQQYATQLLSDLDLPVEVTVTAGATLPATVSERAMRISTTSADVVSGGLAGFEHMIDALDGESIAAAVQLFLYAVRPLVVEHAVDAWAARTWPGSPLTDETRPRLGDFIRLCVDRNLSLWRTRGVLPATPEEVPPWKTLCRLHTDEQVAIGIASPVDVASLDWPSMQARIFEAKGLICPIPVSDDAKWLAADEYQVRINDVHLPVRRSADPASEMVGFVEHLALATPLAFVTCDAVQQRMELAGDNAPFLATDVVARLGIQAVCARMAERVQQHQSIADFEALLDELALETMRYRVP